MIEQFPLYSKDLSSWHDEICKVYSESLTYWWYTQGSRLIAWQPPIYQALFFALALVKFRQLKKIALIFITNAPKEVEEYLSEFDPNGNYKYSFERELQLSFVKKLKNKLGPYWEVIRLFRDALINSKPLNLKRAYDLGIYSHFWGLKHFQQSGDHFFGNMLGTIPPKKKALWIYYPAHFNTDFDKQQMITTHKDNCDIIFIEDHWRILDALLILVKLALYKFKVMFLIKPIDTLLIDNVHCEKFSRKFRKKLIQEFLPLDEFKVESFFKRIYEKTNFSKIIYPFEDKGLERAILAVTPNNTKTYGYAHAIHNPGHLYLDKKFNTFGYPPRPNYLICTGTIAAQAIHLRSNFPVDRILVGGSNRYKERIKDVCSAINNPVRVLLLSGQSHEIGIFANWVEENPEDFKNIELVVRKYPFAYQVEQNTGISRLKKYLPVVEQNLNLEKQIANCNVVVFASTSAGYEGILAGRIGIYAHLHHIVPLNSLEGKGDVSAILKAMNSKELANHIFNLQKISNNELENLINEQCKIVKEIYSKPQLNFLWEENLPKKY